MIHFFIQNIKEIMRPYDVEPLIFGIHLWQYMAMVLLVIVTMLVTWVLLRLLRRIFFSSDVQLESFVRLKRRAYYLTVIGVIMYARPFLELPVNVFWENTMIMLNIVFAIVSLIVANRLIDVIFALVNQKMQKAHWDETGILQLLKAVTKVGTISVTLLLVSGLFVNYGLSSLVKHLSIGAGTVTAIIAFATKDLISNFFGALVVTVGKPFKIGDWIIVNKLEGRVMMIGIRDTKIQTAGGVVIYIPNSMFISKHISNYGKAVYIPVTLDLMLIEASEQALEGFLAGVDELFKTYPRLRKNQCRIEMQYVGLKKGRFTLHLYFEKITEGEKSMHIRGLMKQLAALSKTQGIGLEG